MREEVLAWLLPDGGPDHAPLRRVITALRLLREDARSGPSRRAAPSWKRARAELERFEREERLAAIHALLRACLEALLPADSFLDLGRRGGSYEGAWRVLDACGVPPPRPLEAPGQVVERLLDSARSQGARRFFVELWSARRRHAELGPARAERRWAAWLRAARETAGPAERARILAGLVAARLDRGDPAGAALLREGHEDLLRVDLELQRLFGWSTLFCGDEISARRLLEGLPPALEIPTSVAELRAQKPEWSAWLAGTPRKFAGGAALRAPTRGDLGLLRCAAYALAPDGEPTIVRLDAPPTLRSVRARRGREPAQASPRTTELRARVLSGNFVSWHAASREESPAVLAASDTRALALVPVFDGDRVVRGWVQVACAHHLLPCRARLESLARTWSAAVLAASAPPARPGQRPRWRSRAETQGIRLAATLELRRWYRERFEMDLALDLESRFLRTLMPQLERAASTDEPLLILGPKGSGRRTLARAVHGWSRRSAAPWCEGLGSPCRGMRVIDLAETAEAEQIELASSLSSGRDERLVFLADVPVCALRESRRLESEFERCLGRATLRVPPLRERRDELPELLAVVLAREAGAAGRAAPQLLDEAVALLWRQAWPGHVSELCAFARELVLAYPGASIGRAELGALTRARGGGTCPRLSSRDPAVADLLAALRVTRHKNGACNRARAARYLGWHADTLSQRLREHGLLESAELGDPVEGEGAEEEVVQE